MDTVSECENITQGAKLLGINKLLNGLGYRDDSEVNDNIFMLMDQLCLSDLSDTVGSDLALNIYSFLVPPIQELGNYYTHSMLSKVLFKFIEILPECAQTYNSYEDDAERANILIALENNIYNYFRNGMPESIFAILMRLGGFYSLEYLEISPRTVLSHYPDSDMILRRDMPDNIINPIMRSFPLFLFTGMEALQHIFKKQNRRLRKHFRNPDDETFRRVSTFDVMNARIKWDTCVSWNSDLWIHNVMSLGEYLNIDASDDSTEFPDQGSNRMSHFWIRNLLFYSKISNALFGQRIIFDDLVGTPTLMKVYD